YLQVQVGRLKLHDHTEKLVGFRLLLDFRRCFQFRRRDVFWNFDEIAVGFCRFGGGFHRFRGCHAILLPRYYRFVGPASRARLAEKSGSADLPEQDRSSRLLAGRPTRKSYAKRTGTPRWNRYSLVARMPYSL